MPDLQIVWWGRLPAFRFWHYPRSWRNPIFYALYLGLIELRYFPKKRLRKVGGNNDEKEEQTMNFDEWKKWKESQTTSTCDYVGCTRLPTWKLPKNNVFFCVEHSLGVNWMRDTYGEEPVYLPIQAWVSLA